MNIIILGWAAVSSRPQADDDKISLTRQIAMNIIEARRWGHMPFQLVIPGYTRDITLFEEAATRVTGWRFDCAGLANLEGDQLDAAIDARLAGLRGTPYIYPYAELKTLIDQKAFHCFSFYNIGRVGRDAALSLTVMRLCQRSNVFTYSTKAPPTSLDAKARRSYQANLMDAIQAVSYENEVRQLQEDHRDGMILRVQSGRMPGNVNFGYIVKRDAKGKVAGYEIDGPAAETVRAIVALYLDHGMGGPSIADALNRAGHDTPATRAAKLAGKAIPDDPPPWAAGQVDYIIKIIMRYAGLNEINRYSKKGRPHITAPGIWPPIITEERARAVVAERSTRRGQGRAVARTYRFTRLLYCDICKGRLSATNGYTTYTVKSTGETKRAYTLKWHCREGHVTTTDKRVYGVIREAINQAQLATQSRRIESDELTIPVGAVDEEMAGIQAAIRRLESSILQVDVDHYVHAKIDGERHTAIVRAIKKQITDAKHQLTILQDQAHALLLASQYDQRIDDVRRDGERYLTDPDIAKANAWFRRHLIVYVAPGRKFYPKWI